MRAAPSVATGAFQAVLEEDVAATREVRDLRWQIWEIEKASSEKRIATAKSELALTKESLVSKTRAMQALNQQLQSGIMGFAARDPAERRRIKRVWERAKQPGGAAKLTGAELRLLQGVGGDAQALAEKELLRRGQIEVAGTGLFVGMQRKLFGMALEKAELEAKIVHEHKLVIAEENMKLLRELGITKKELQEYNQGQDEVLNILHQLLRQNELEELRQRDFAQQNAAAGS
jgi:hypothetical protein